MSTLPSLLVLCTGNSCRSQMAEGYFRHLAGDRFHVESAGTEPKDFVHPLAVEVMAEDGVDITAQRPKALKQFLGRLPVRYMITVCGDADEKCPRIWPGLVARFHWPIDDPAAFAGPREEMVNEFRRVRDEIKRRIETWLKDTT